jgi:uncharacterized SAM-binding protein YcdF (DUF218 family)
VIVRLFGLAALAWCLGFAAFMLMLPKPTGGAGRIDRGIALLQARQARRMLVTGVAPGVRPIDLAREYKVPVTLFGCCIDLGADAVDTRSNAEETAAWVKTHDYRTVRLVTSDWHVPRARMELAAAMGPGVQVLGDGVPSTPRLGTLVNEYNKLILRRVALWLGVGA